MTPVEVIELKNRELIPLKPLPGFIIRHFGVALDHDEAQNFIARGYRVFGDENGPYLVIRVPARMRTPAHMDSFKYDVSFKPIPWELRDERGVICWLTKFD